MNLCFFTEHLNQSGDGKNLTFILEGLSKAGHEISVVLLEEDRTPDGFEYLKKIYPVQIRGRKTAAFKRRKALIQDIVNDNNFDAGIAFGINANIDAALSLRGTKLPLILCVRDNPEFVPNDFSKKALRKISYPFATGIIFQTEEQKAFFPKKLQARSFVIPNFLDSLPPLPQNTQKEHSIVSYSRLENEQKNMFMLFDAFADFAKSHPEYTLKVFGDGPDKEKCETYISEIGCDWNIKLLGEPDDVTGRIYPSEIFVLTSNYEGMPNTLLSAMSIGMPCISTDCGGVRDLIQNGQSGVIVDKNDTKTMSEALSFLADNDEIRNRLGENARTMMQFFTAEKILPLWEEAINRLIHPETEVVSAPAEDENVPEQSKEQPETVQNPVDPAEEPNDFAADEETLQPEPQENAETESENAADSEVLAETSAESERETSTEKQDETEPKE